RSVRERLVLRYVNRFPRHAEFQRSFRSPFHERSFPAGSRRRSLRPYAERQGPLPSGAGHRQITELCLIPSPQSRAPVRARYLDVLARQLILVALVVLALRLPFLNQAF